MQRVKMQFSDFEVSKQVSIQVWYQSQQIHVDLNQFSTVQIDIIFYNHLQAEIFRKI